MHRQATFYNTVNPACLRCHDDGWRDFGIACLCFFGRLRLSALGYTGDRAGMAFDPTGMPFALHHGFPCCAWFATGDRRPSLRRQPVRAVSDWRDAELDLSVFIQRAVDAADLTPLVPWAAARLIETLPSSGCVPYAEGFRGLLERADRAELAFHGAAMTADPARPRNEWTIAFGRLLAACEFLQHGDAEAAGAYFHNVGRILAALVASAKLGRAGGVRLSEGVSPGTAVREWRETYAETLRTWCPKPPPL